MVERKGKLHGFIEFVFVSKHNHLLKKKIQQFIITGIGVFKGGKQ